MKELFKLIVIVVVGLEVIVGREIRNLGIDC